MRLQIFLTPADDAELIEQAQALLQAVCNGPTEEQVVPPGDDDRRAVDPLSVATLVLAVPGAALALVQLAERLGQGTVRPEIKQRIEPVLVKAREETRQVALQVGEQTLDLGQVSADQVLDALEAAGISARGAG